MTWPKLDPFSSANFLDHFPGSSLDARWTAVTAGSGSVTVTDSYAEIVASAANNNAAFIYYNTKLDKTKSQLWLACVSKQTSGDTPFIGMFLVNGASAPAMDTSGNINAKTLLRRDMNIAQTSPALGDFYFSSGGTQTWWDGPNSTWTTTYTTSLNTIMPTQHDDYYVLGLELDGTNARWRLLAWNRTFSSAGTWTFNQGWILTGLSDWVTWANTRSSSDIWLVLGRPANDRAAAATMRVEWVRYIESVGNKVVNGWDVAHQDVGTDPNAKAYHVYSYDGQSFVPQDRSTKALDVGASAPDNGQIGEPFAVWDGASTDWLFYTGTDGSGNRTICVASATHVAATGQGQTATFTRYASNPIIPLGSAGANDDSAAAFPWVIYDLSDPDSSKRWKLLYSGRKASDSKWRLMYATAPSPTGTWTKQATVLDVGAGGANDEKAARDAVVAYVNGQWEVWYEGWDASNVGHLMRATGTDLASLTKDATYYTPTTVAQSLTANLNTAPGRTVTIASTTGFEADANVVLSQSSDPDTWSASRIRKVASSTSLELYHGLTGFTTTFPTKIKQTTSTVNFAPRLLTRVGAEWWLYTVPWGIFDNVADDGQSVLLEETYLMKHSGNTPADATFAYDQQIGAVTYRNRFFGAGSVENLTMLNEPFAPLGLFAFDTFTSSTRTDTSDPYTFNHAGALADVAGVIVTAAHGTSSTDHIVGITYGGQSLTRYQTNTDTATEPGRTDIWFLGDKALIPDGTQTVSVDLSSATTDDIHFVCMTLVAPGNTEVIDSDGINENAANPTVTMNKGGRWAMSFAALYGGGSAPGGTIQTGCQRVASSDLGLFYSDVLREDSFDPSDQAIGFSTLATDDVAFAAIAVAPRVSLVTNPRPLAHLLAR